MNLRRGKRAVIGLSALGVVAAAAIGIAPAAHAQSTSPLVSASITSIGSTYQVAVSGSGFTPGGSVTLELIDRTTGAVLGTSTVQASANTTQTTYVSEPQQVCTIAADTAASSTPLPPPGYGMNPSPLQCQTTTVSLPQTTYVDGGGAIASSISVTPTSDGLAVEAIDTATNTVSNVVALTDPGASAATLSAASTSTGSTRVVVVSGTGYTAGSTLVLEVINTATGAVVETITLPASAVTSSGLLAFNFPLASSAGTGNLGLRVVNTASQWHSAQVLIASGY